MAMARERTGRWAQVAEVARRAWRPLTRRPSGQAIIEFAVASMVFMMIVFGTIDFGRAIFVQAELHNGVREGARVGKVKCGNTAAIKQAVLDKSPAIGLTAGAIGVSNSGCTPPKGTVTVSASVNFTAITAGLLGLPTLNLDSTATVDVE